MLSHVTLRPRTVNGRPTWILLGPDGREMPAFTAFAKSLRNDAPHTQEAYCRHVAEFLDYLIAYALLLKSPPTRLELSAAIEAYGDYLQLGTDSTYEIARAVASERPSSPNASTSLVPKKAAIRRFLSLSEEIRKQLAEQGADTASAPLTIDLNPLFEEIGGRRMLSPFEIKAMQANSMIAGVVAGGPKFIGSVVLKGTEKSTAYDQSRAFPFDKAIDLINTAPSYRDRSYYALSAACGGRAHEILQILLEDINVSDGTVRLVDPSTRKGHSSYRYLSSEKRFQLSYKGRTTPRTLLIEPFASMFFEALESYFRHEHIAHGRHDFVFQYLKGEQRGQPYFLSAASSRTQQFHHVCRQIGVVLPPRTGPHSLRHMYGTYLLNYFPRLNGEYGLPPTMVQQLMGHELLKSTLQYARHDEELLKLELQNANNVLFRKGTPRRLVDMRIAALEAQVLKLRRELREDEGIND